MWKILLRLAVIIFAFVIAMMAVRSVDTYLKVQQVRGLGYGRLEEKKIHVSPVAGLDRYIADAVGAVVRVDLSNTRLEPRMWSNVCSWHTIEYLDAHDASISDGHIVGFSELTALRELRVGENDISDRGIEQIYSLTELRVLWLNDTRVTDRSLDLLSQHVSLETLVLSRTMISDASAYAFPSFGQLKKLVLDGTSVTDSSMQSIAMIPKLKTLSVANTAVSERGLVELRGCTSLETLIVSTRVPSESIDRLEKLLGCEILQWDAAANGKTGSTGKY